MKSPSQDARRTLGLGSEKITRARIAKLWRHRHSLAQKFQSASDPAQRKLIRQKLDAFDDAFTILLSEWEAPDADSTSPNRLLLVLIPWLIVLTAAAFGWPHFQQSQNALTQRDARIRQLETLGWQHIDNRRWSEADAAFGEINKLIPGNALSRIGHESANAGRAEEETQFIAYWTGQSLAELDAGRLDEATAAARRVLDAYPKNTEAASLILRIEQARIEQSILNQISAIRSLIEQRDWQSAATRADELAALHPQREDITLIAQEARTGLQRFLLDQETANTLYQKALARNIGEFDQSALDWLREAAALSPQRKDIASLLETMSSYKRTLRVPEDFPTPAAALAQSRDNDRIVLAKGTWQGPLVVNHSIELQGTGHQDTIIANSADQGNVITIHAPGVRISGITFRHTSFIMEGNERFSTATVTRGNTGFANCRFADSTSHGLSVVQGASAVISRCLFQNNTWNGVAAIGKGSSITMRDSVSSGNFHNGVETWLGATATLTQNRITSNSRNGIHADQADSPITIHDNLLSDNREYGILLTAASEGSITQNKSSNNLLGGILVRSKAASVTITDNEFTANKGPDIILESGIPTAPYSQNSLTHGRANALRADAKITP